MVRQKMNCSSSPTQCVRPKRSKAIMDFVLSESVSLTSPSCHLKYFTFPKQDSLLVYGRCVLASITQRVAYKHGLLIVYIGGVSAAELRHYMMAETKCLFSSDFFSGTTSTIGTRILLADVKNEGTDNQIPSSNLLSKIPIPRFHELTIHGRQRWHC